MQALHLTHDIRCFIFFRKSLIDDNGIAFCIIRPKFLFLPLYIILDDCICRHQYIFGRTVILLQQNYRCLRIVSLKVQDIPHICTAPTVDRLIRIADNADIVVSRRKQFRYLILCTIRILVLVNKNITELFLIFRPHCLIL